MNSLQYVWLIINFNTMCTHIIVSYCTGQDVDKILTIYIYYGRVGPCNTVPMQYIRVVNSLKDVELVIHFDITCAGMKFFYEKWQEMERCKQFRVIVRQWCSHKILFIQCTSIMHSLKYMALNNFFMLHRPPNCLWKITKDGQNMKILGKL